MFRFRRKTIIFISGTIWLAAGISLLFAGLNFIVRSAQNSLVFPRRTLPLLNLFAEWTGGFEQAAMSLAAIALIIGFIKGRYVLAKSVNRLASRINSCPEPVSLFYMYSPPYYVLVGSMILLGMGLKYFGISDDIRGLIDSAVGAALINGSMLYFRIGAAAGAEPV